MCVFQLLKLNPVVISWSAADAVSTVEARRRRKEYAVKRRINWRREDAAAGNVYEAGGH